MTGRARQKDEEAVFCGILPLTRGLDFDGPGHFAEVVSRNSRAGNAEKLPPSEARSVPQRIGSRAFVAAPKSVFHAVSVPQRYLILTGTPYRTRIYTDLTGLHG